MLKNITSLRLKITLVVFALFVATLAMIYIFAWRPSNTDYSVALEKLHSISSSASSVSEVTNSIKYASDINDDMVTLMENTAKQYDSALASLTTNATTTRDFTVKTSFNKARSSLTEYGKSANSFVDSIKKYRSTVRSCAPFIQKISQFATINDFDIAAKDCDSALDAATSAQFEPLNSSFLREYTSELSNYITEYRKVLEATETRAQQIPIDKLNTANAKLTELYEKELPQTELSDPTDAISQLTSTLERQRNQLIR